MSSTSYLSRSVTPSTATSWTVSFWFKVTNINPSSGTPYLWSCGSSSGGHGIYYNNPTDVLRYYGHTGYTDAALSSGVLRDTNAWYHCVLSVNAGTGTSYINGVQQGSTISSMGPLNAHTGNLMAVNAYVGGLSTYDDGGFLMSHFHFIDGTAYPASTFGETDSTTGQWKIKTNVSVTYGTNGFFLFKDNASANDQSGNSNNFTATGTITNTEDCPSNVFATWNAIKKVNTVALSNGNTTASGNADDGVWGTIGDNQGKWYWETQNNENNTVVGIASEDVTQATGRSENTGVYGLQNGTTYAYYRNNGSSGQSSGFPQTTTSNTVCHALDLDNGKYFVGVDGVFKNLSGTTSNLGTGADPTFTGLDTTKFWFPFTECRGTGAGCDANFGNGYFGTTAISSEGTNASGIGKFEYDVPAGYTALSTKGLNE